MQSRENKTRVLLSLAAGRSIDVLPDDWPDAVQLLAEPEIRYWNRLLIPIYGSLKKQNALTRVPNPYRSVLQTRFMELLAVQTGQQLWLAKLVECFTNRNIPTILLKGSGVVGTLYEKSYARLSQDIDLLVRAVDYSYVIDLLCVHGTREEIKPGRIFSDTVRHETSIELHTPFPFFVEPHRSLVPDRLFRLEENEIWQRSVKHPVYNSEDIRLLSTEDTLIFLSIHSFLHLEYEPHHLIDAVRLLDISDTDFEKMYRIASQWKCATILYTFFHQLDYWFGTGHPVPLSRKIRFRIGKEFLHSPLNPDSGEPHLFDQVRSMILHDSYWQVGLFSLSYCRKKLADFIIG